MILIARNAPREICRRVQPNICGAFLAFRPASTAPIDDGAGQFSLWDHCSKSNGPQDVGGLKELLQGPLDVSDGPKATFWQRRTHALLVTLVGSRHMRVDELRRGIEALDREKYANWGISIYCCLHSAVPFIWVCLYRVL